MKYLACPVCQSELLTPSDDAKDSNLKCTNNHSFDRARQGYWNLLLAQQKKSKNPGDDKAMVDARRNFLQMGLYQPIAESISQLALDLIPDDAQAWLDIGCGEGYYSSFIQKKLLTKTDGIQAYGLDISKDAVKAACRYDKDIHWLVASGANAPVQAHSMNLLTCLFTRLMPEAFAKLLPENGHIIIANSGEQHLIELRKIIYGEVKPGGLDPVAVMSSHFEPVGEPHWVKCPLTLNQTQLQALLAMTPHYWRASQEAKDVLAKLEQLTVTVDVRLDVFSPKAQMKEATNTQTEEQPIKQIEPKTEGTLPAEKSPETSTIPDPWKRSRK